MRLVKQNWLSLNKMSIVEDNSMAFGLVSRRIQTSIIGHLKAVFNRCTKIATLLLSEEKVLENLEFNNFKIYHFTLNNLQYVQ